MALKKLPEVKNVFDDELRFRQKVRKYFKEYCDSTSMHGFRYLGERRSPCEKLWWFGTITISITLCCFLIYQTYNKWDRTPVLVSFATTQTPIWQVPFPAVTICSEIKASRSLYNLTDYHLKKRSGENLTDEEEKQFEKMALVCKTQWAYKWNVSVFDENVLDFLDDVAPEPPIIICSWGGKQRDCGELFTRVITRQGMCFTFNMLDRNEMFQDDVEFYRNHSTFPKSQGWSLDKGYGDDLNKETYPERALFFGARSGLKVTLVTLKRDIDYLCGDSLQGFRVHLSHPAKVPRPDEQYFRVGLDESTSAGIDMKLMTTSDALKHYLPQRRKCYFSEEKPLRYYKIYSQENCEMECAANYTLTMCGCLPFYLPRLASTPICGPAKKQCIRDADRRRLNDGVTTNLEDNKVAEVNLNGTTLLHLCDCLPSCTSLTYNTETSQVQWDWSQHVYDLGYQASPLQLAHLSQIRIFFKEMQYVASERGELYGHTDFMANCGGLLGLFTGFSFLSLIEIFYFLSLRLFCNLRKHGRKFWHGEE